MWLGFAKLGVVTAWINNTIKLTPLVHSIRVSQAKMVVFGAELTHVMKDVARDLTANGIEQVIMSGTCAFVVHLMVNCLSNLRRLFLVNIAKV